MKNSNNNQGFSLIELIVIMVIIVVLATAVVVSFVNRDDQKVKSSTSMVTKFFDNVLNDTLTRDSAWLVISCDDDGDYIIEDYINNSGQESKRRSEKITSGVSIKYTDKNGEVELGKNTKLTLVYDRANGFAGPMKKDIVPPDYVRSIKISCGDSAKTIKFYNKTGVYEVID